MVEVILIDEGMAEKIEGIQKAAFMPLLEKYGDYEINPALESVETIRRKISNPATRSYVFRLSGADVGWVRITDMGERTCKVSALCVLPEYQNRGIAQDAMKQIEAIHSGAEKWVLGTIREEEGDCHLYEKLGYKRVGAPEVINSKMTIVGYEKIVDKEADKGNLIDLHTHSCYSDGTETPADILLEAKRKGVSVLAITDHDVLEGSRELLAIPDKMGVRCVSGVELTAFQNGESYHVLGYGFELDNQEFKEFVGNNQECLERVSTQLIEKMAKAGEPVSLEDYGAYRYDRKKGGWKALNYFVERGLARSHYEALLLYGKYSQGYGEAGFPDIKNVCLAIHRAGGRAVLAHPGKVIGEEHFKEKLENIMECGLDGIECWYPSHSEEITGLCLKLCRDKGLLITCGSDSHGRFQLEDTPIGIMKVTAGKTRLAF